MKKALPILALLAVVAGLIVYTMRRTGGGGARFPIDRAAELAPADSTAFFFIPDLQRAAVHWEEYKAAVPTREKRAEDSWLRWASPHQLLSSVLFAEESAESDEAIALVRRLPELQKAEPAGLFLAADDTSAGPLKLVGGFPYRGKKSDLERILRALKDQLFKTWPGSTSELSLHRGIEFETLAITTPAKSPVPVVHLAFRDDWLFFSTDRSLLTGVLDRYLAVPEASPSLAKRPVFVECRAHAAPERDIEIWKTWETSEYGWGRGQIPISIHVWDDQANLGQAIHYTARLGATASEQLYLHFTHPPQSRSPGSPGAPDAQLLPTVNLDAFRRKGQQGIELHSSGTWSSLGIPLFGRNQFVDNLWTAFGPAVCFIGSRQTYKIHPPLLVAFEVRDEVKARAFVDDLMRLTRVQARVFRDAEATRWEWEPVGTSSPPPPPLLLTKTHLLFRVPENSSYIVDREFKRIEAESIVLTKSTTLPPRNKADLPWPAILKHLDRGAIDVRPAGPGWVIESSVGELYAQKILEHLR